MMGLLFWRPQLLNRFWYAEIWNLLLGLWTQISFLLNCTSCSDTVRRLDWYFKQISVWKSFLSLESTLCSQAKFQVTKCKRRFQADAGAISLLTCCSCYDTVFWRWIADGRGGRGYFHWGGRFSWGEWHWWGSWRGWFTQNNFFP